MGNRECSRLKGNPCGPLRLNTINVTMPPQYCVTRAMLYCLVEDAGTFSWMTRREKQWLIAYVQVAGPEPVEVAYDEAVELYEQADALDSQA